MLDDDSRTSVGEMGGVHGPGRTVASSSPTSIVEDPHITIDRPVLAVPTGPVPVAPSPTRATLQGLVIVVAASLVGLAVFYTVKYAVSDHGDDGTDVAQLDVDEETLIAPGPGDPGDEGRFGSKRSSVDGEDGVGSDAFVPGDPTGLGRNADVAIGSEGADQAGGTAVGPGLDPSGPAMAGAARSSGTTPPAGSDNVLSVGATTPTTGSGATEFGGSPNPPAPGGTTAPVTNPSAVAPGPSGSATTAQPTTTAPRPSTTATTNSTTSTSTSTSAATAPTRPGSLILAPVAGASLSWESPIRVRAAAVPGAKRYCWTIEGVRSVRSCGTDPMRDLPGGRKNLGPGRVTLVAEAMAGGKIIMSEKISVMLVTSDLVKQPMAGAAYETGGRLRLVAAKVPSATSYCWSLSRGSISSGEICSTDPKLVLPANSTTLAGVGTGSTVVEVVAYAGTETVGHQQISINLIDKTVPLQTKTVPLQTRNG